VPAINRATIKIVTGLVWLESIVTPLSDMHGRSSRSDLDKSLGIVCMDCSQGVGGGTANMLSFPNESCNTASARSHSMQIHVTMRVYNHLQAEVIS